MALHINFLPHRTWALQRRRQAFWRDLRWVVALTVVASALGYVAVDAYWQANQAAVVQYRNHLLQLRQMAAAQARVQQELVSVRAKQSLVTDLEAEQLNVARLWSELALGLVDGLYLTDVQMSEQGLTIKGYARGEQDVMALRSHLAQNHLGWTGFTVVELVNNAAASGDAQTHFLIRARSLSQSGSPGGRS